MLQCRSVVVATEATWDLAVSVARAQVAFAATLPGTISYEIYADGAQHELVQLAAYTDVAAWLAHSRSNPHAEHYMQLVTLQDLEVYGASTPELEAMLSHFGAVKVRQPVSETS